MINNQIFFLANEQETLNFGRSIAQVCKNTTIIYLNGDIGSGKTTFIRGFLQELGYNNVKSPTYTLIESYHFKNIKIHHFDLYRIKNPEELEFIGIRDYFSDNAIILVEWPKLGVDILPNPDIEIYINYKNQGREVYIHNTYLLDNDFYQLF